MYDPKLMKILKFLIILSPLFLASCAIGPGVISYNVSVNSYASPEAAQRKKFVILPGLKDVDQSDLEFVEFANLISRVLERRGFVRASDFQDADLAVFLAYSLGNPDEHSYSYSVPQFGQTGIASSSTYGTVRNTGSGSATYSGTTYHTPTYGITGYSSQVASYTTYTRILSMEGVDLIAYRETKNTKQVWKTKVASIGSSSDLRKVIPAMLIAAYSHIATSTGQILALTIRDDDSRLIDLRTPQPAALNNQTNPPTRQR